MESTISESHNHITNGWSPTHGSSTRSFVTSAQPTVGVSIELDVLASMRFFATSMLLAALAFPAIAQQTKLGDDKVKPQNGGAAIVYSDGGAFLIEGPKGWTTDREAGQRLGTCCVYYPAGATWDNAETVMYPNIATKGPGQKPLREFMAYDLADFREHNPEMSYEDAEDIPLKNKRTANLRYFHNVNGGSSEAVAYVEEEKIIALVVVSSKTAKGLNETIPLLRSVLQTYAYMDVKVINDSKPGKGQSFQLPKEKLQ